MGGGSRMSSSSCVKNSVLEELKRAPSTKPPFTLGDLKKVIPPHCFKRSIVRSFSYLFYDIAQVIVLYYIATNYIKNLPNILFYPAWVLYWFSQGVAFSCLWVIAHECGHHAFSDYQWLDDTVGFILHSLLLVPYFSWKYSHRKHHSNASSLDRDEPFVPKTKANAKWYNTYPKNPLFEFLVIAFKLLLGWFLYITINFWGPLSNNLVCHFDPYSPIYSPKERFYIFISNLGLLVVLYGLYSFVLANSFIFIFCFYGMPLLFVNGSLVLVTYLHHTHPTLPHYDSSEWDWLRGSLATVDRDYGRILNKLSHNITNTHVIHHLFPTIPHYHAVEATNAIKPILGHYYRYDDTRILKVLWKVEKECIYVEPDEGETNKGVFWYRNKM